MNTNLPGSETGNSIASDDSARAFPASTPLLRGRSRAPAWLFAGMLALAALPGCDADKKPVPAVVKSVDDRFPIKIGDRTVQMQLAVLDGELERGLMYRTTMGADEGMVFVFAGARPQSFWMRNTKLPLDIGYIDAAGELQEVRQMYPLDERPVPSHSRSIQFCLEMNQGWFEQAGVKPGAKLDLKALAEALTARGFKLEAFGLPKS
jgi:uncharacterized membrane protein (UPF0127 family)